MIIDANILLRGFLADEAQAQAQALIHDYIVGRLALRAPELIRYEICNAIWQAERRGRVTSDQAEQVLRAVEGLDIEIEAISWQEMLPLARRFGCSAYDAAYLALAASKDEPFITGDLKLFNSVHTSLGWVRWIGGYEVDTALA
jgi:predicted nucleic acid-binding protein